MINGILYSILSAVLASAFVYYTVPPLIRVIKTKNLYEPLDSRKLHHKKNIPTIGGVSIFIGFTLASIIASDGFDYNDIIYIFPATIIMFFMGLKDDLVNLSANKKLVIQIVVAIMLATIGNFRLSSLYGILGIHEVPYVLGVFISVILILALVNAWNLIDGVDGLASGIAFIASATFGICFILMEHYNLAVVSFALTGSVACFFFYNVFGKKNKLFMGDTGSLIIGTIMVVLALKYMEVAALSDMYLLSYSPPAFAVGVVILPIIDLIRIVVVRVWNKRQPFKPDGDHIHHLLLKLFPRHLTVTLILMGSSLIFIPITLLLLFLNLNINFIIAIQLFIGFSAASIPFFVHK